MTGPIEDKAVSTATPTSAACNRFLINEVVASLPIAGQDGDACTTCTASSHPQEEIAMAVVLPSLIPTTIITATSPTFMQDQIRSDQINI
jgi:hypothetical protein